MGEEVRTDIDEESCIIGLKEAKNGDEVVVMEDKGTEGGVEESQGSRNYTYLRCSRTKVASVCG